MKPAKLLDKNVIVSLRWCLPQPTQCNASNIDAFIDKYLYHLPLPRIDREFEGLEPSEDQLFECLSIERKRQGLKGPKVCGLSKIADEFNRLVPMLPSLRHKDTQKHALMCALALLALFPEESQSITSDDVTSLNFVQRALTKLGLDAFETTAETVLIDANVWLEGLRLENVFDKLPKASDTWIFLSDATEFVDLNFIHLKLMLWSEMYDIHFDVLKMRARLKNIVDEDLEIGF